MNIHAIIELQQATGTNEKVNVIKKYSEDESFRNILYYALNPLLTYNLSENSLSFTEVAHNLSEKFLSTTFKDIFDCCDCLSRLRGIDDATIRQVKQFLSQVGEDEKDIYTKLLSKTLRFGVTAKTVNKVIPGLIPEWEVQQAYSIDNYPLNPNTEFWLTEKLNGVRATFYNGKFYARSGAVFEGLNHIIDEIRWVQPAGLVLDGELTLKDKDNISDNEAFRIATGILNSDEVNKTGICYTIFDAIPVKEFESDFPRTKYSARRDVLLSSLNKSLNNSVYTKVLPVLYHGKDITVINGYLEKMVVDDKEGLIVNLDVPYKRTRHNGILKVKRFYTMDLPIVNCEEGTGRLKGTLGAFVLDYKGNEVRVGSGFTDEQRKAFWKTKDQLCGMLCEVKYKEISQDRKTKLESLQFPVFVQLRKDKSEISYE